MNDLIKNIFDENYPESKRFKYWSFRKFIFICNISWVEKIKLLSKSIIVIILLGYNINWLSYTIFYCDPWIDCLILLNYYLLFSLKVSYLPHAHVLSILLFGRALFGQWASSLIHLLMWWTACYGQDHYLAMTSFINVDDRILNHLQVEHLSFIMMSFLHLVNLILCGLI